MPSVRNGSISGIKRTVWPERQKFLPATAIHPHLPVANIRTRTILRNGEPPDAVSAGIGSPAQRSLLLQGRGTEHIRGLRVLVCEVGKPRSISARISSGGGITVSPVSGKASRPVPQRHATMFSQKCPKKNTPPFRTACGSKTS